MCKKTKVLAPKFCLKNENAFKENGSPLRVTFRDRKCVFFYQKAFLHFPPRTFLLSKEKVGEISFKLSYLLIFSNDERTFCKKSTQSFAIFAYPMDACVDLK